MRIARWKRLSRAHKLVAQVLEEAEHMYHVRLWERIIVLGHESPPIVEDRVTLGSVWVAMAGPQSQRLERTVDDPGSAGHVQAGAGA